jgi:hypothetical protein
MHGHSGWRSRREAKSRRAPRGAERRWVFSSESRRFSADFVSLNPLDRCLNAASEVKLVHALNEEGDFNAGRSIGKRQLVR